MQTLGVSIAHLAPGEVHLSLPYFAAVRPAERLSPRRGGCQHRGFRQWICSLQPGCRRHRCPRGRVQDQPHGTGEGADLPCLWSGAASRTYANRLPLPEVFAIDGGDRVPVATMLSTIIIRPIRAGEP